MRLMSTPLQRFHVRPDSHGYTVYDIWTGDPAVLALVVQTGLCLEDARELAKLLSEAADHGQRVLLQ